MGVIMTDENQSPTTEAAPAPTSAAEAKGRKMSTVEKPKAVCLSIFEQLKPEEGRKVALARCVEAGVSFNTADFHYTYWNKARKEAAAAAASAPEQQAA